MMLANQNFVTRSGNLYIVDDIHHTICGGQFVTPVEYVGITARPGQPARIALADGTNIRTSVVEKCNVQTQKQRGMEFRTAHSTYILNFDEHTISGGKFEQPIKYETFDSLKIGEQARIDLPNGKVIRTSSVKDFRPIVIDSLQQRNQHKSTLFELEK